MASILKVDKIRGTGLDSDTISLDGSGNITIPKNVTFSGTVAGAETEYSIAHAMTSTNRTITGVSSWTDHLSVTFTTTKVQTLQCIGQFSHGYENGQVMLAGRFNLDGSSTTTELQVFKQGHGINFSHGAHNLHGFFTNVSAGSHTVYVNRTVGSTDSVSFELGTTELIAMEIAP